MYANAGAARADRRLLDAAGACCIHAPMSSGRARRAAGSVHGSRNLRSGRRRGYRPHEVGQAWSSAGTTEGGGREAVSVDCGRGRRRVVHRRVERVECVRRVERAAQGSPIKIGVLTPLSPGASNFVPWGSRCAPGGTGGERDQQVGRRQGARAGAAAQPRRRGRPVPRHTAAIDGFRRLTQQENVVSVGASSAARSGRRRGSPRRRRCRCS